MITPAHCTPGSHSRPQMVGNCPVYGVSSFFTVKTVDCDGGLSFPASLVPLTAAKEIDHGHLRT